MPFDLRCLEDYKHTTKESSMSTYCTITQPVNFRYMIRSVVAYIKETRADTRTS